MDILGSRAGEPVLREPAHQRFEALSRDLCVVDRVVDEFGGDRSVEGLKFTFARDTEKFGQARERMGLARQGCGERPEVKKIPELVASASAVSADGFVAASWWSG